MKEKEGAGLLHPRDRNGRVMADRYASAALEDALEDFRAACAAAAAAMRACLRQLASQLQVCPCHGRTAEPTASPMYPVS